MQCLPRGYYAVQSDFENAPKDSFVFGGVTYAVEAGVNLFATAKEADLKATETPDTVLEGLPYGSFSAPVLLFSAGRHKVDGFRANGSRYLLGQRVGVTPNLPSTDPLEPPVLNPARNAEGESVLWGSYYGGTMVFQKQECALALVDGFTVEDARFGCWTTAPTKCMVAFKNLLHTGPCGHYIYDLSERRFDGEILLENIRLQNFDDLGYGGTFLYLSVPKATLRGVCYDTTTQLFGLSTFSRTLRNDSDVADVAEYTIEDSYFRNMGGENGISTYCGAPKGQGIALRFDRCTFVNASRENEGVIQPHMANKNCTLSVKGCTFVDTRNNTGAAIVTNGKTEGVSLESCTFEGFACEVAKAPAAPKHAPDYIKNRRMDWTTKTEDPHRVIGTDKADFIALDIRYEGKKAYYGDQHMHTNCGGTSDGAYPMNKWVAKMNELKIDFAFVVDHRQMRGFFLPEWDTDRFVYGTEPGGSISDLKGARPAPGTHGFHYNMLFRDKYDLALVLANFPEFKFKGDRLTGKFGYPGFTRERFTELVNYVHSLGGMMVHPHPTSIMSSTEPSDYSFGEYTYFETLYNTYNAVDSFHNYAMWVRMLNEGLHVYTAGGTDTHGEPRNSVVSTFYCKERTGTAAFDCMKSGDFTVGAFGIKMCIDGKPMGSRIAYRDGMKLTLRVDDLFEPERKDNTAYELRVYTDEGLAYAASFNGKQPQALSLAVHKRRYYRAEVFNLTGGYRIAVSNPIWLDKEEQ